MFVIVRKDDGGAFVARRGEKGSYTQQLQKARVFLNRLHACKQLCSENEYVVSVEQLLQGNIDGFGED